MGSSSLKFQRIWLFKFFHESFVNRIWSMSCYLSFLASIFHIYKITWMSECLYKIAISWCQVITKFTFFVFQASFSTVKSPSILKYLIVTLGRVEEILGVNFPTKHEIIIQVDEVSWEAWDAMEISFYRIRIECG